MKKTNIVYIRTSTEEQVPENQLKDTLSLIPNQKFKVYKDKQSAWKEGIKDRPEFKESLRLIRSGNVDSFNVWDLDRIYRNRIKTVQFMNLCQYYGVTVRSYRQQWLNSFDKVPPPFNEIFKDMLIQICGWISEEESQKKSDRIKIAYRNHNGAKWGRPTNRLTGSQKEEIIYLREHGFSIRAISRKMQISKYYVESTINENKKQKAMQFIKKCYKESHHKQ